MTCADLNRGARKCWAISDQLMIDANQVWEVSQAIDWVGELAFARPWFIESRPVPTMSRATAKFGRVSHPIKVATGEMWPESSASSSNS